MSGSRTSIIFRGVDASNYWLSLLYYTGSIYQVCTAYYEAGSLKGSQNATVSATTNSWYTLRVVDTGSTVRRWWNGTKILTHNSTVHNAGQRVGLWMDNTSLRADDFLAASAGATVLTVAGGTHAHAAGAPVLTRLMPCPWPTRHMRTRPPRPRSPRPMPCPWPTRHMRTRLPARRSPKRTRSVLPDASHAHTAGTALLLQAHSCW